MKKTDQQLLEDQQCPAIILLGIVVSKLGPECLEWDPLAIDLEVKDTFGISLTQLQYDKLMAAVDVLHHNNFENNWHLFNKICRVLSNDYTQLSTLESAEVEHITLGVLEAGLIRQERIEFSDEVKAFMGQVFYEAGFVNPPKLFPFAIMQKKEDLPDHNDDEKNAALQQIVDVRVKEIEEYLSLVT